VRIYVVEFDPFASTASTVAAVLIVALFVLIPLALVPTPSDFQRTLLTVLAVSAVLLAIGAAWGYALYAQLGRSLKAVADGLRIEGLSILLPRRLRASLGVLTIKIASGTGEESGYSIRQLSRLSDARDFSEVKLSDFARIGTGAGVIVEERRAYEWVSLPVLEIREQGFRNRLGSVVLGFVPKTSYTVSVDKAVLRASRGGDWAEVELNPSRGVLRGRLKYVKHPFQSESRSARVELEVRFDLSKLGFTLLSVRSKVLRKTLAELREPGAADFEFRPPEAAEPVVIVGISSKLTTDDVLEALGLEAPTVFGDGWRYAEARLRLVLDVPMGRDVVDEAEVKVEPVAE